MGMMVFQLGNQKSWEIPMTVATVFLTILPMSWEINGFNGLGFFPEHPHRKPWGFYMLESHEDETGAFRFQSSLHSTPLFGGFLK